MSEKTGRDPNPARRILREMRTLVIGHRGYREVAPENTLPSFELALAAHPDLVELDYRHSADGVPVCIHDATVTRTTDAKKRWKDGDHRVATRTLADLRKLDAGAWKHERYAGTRIPTLQEAIETIRPGAVPLLERKEGDAATLARLLRERGLVNQVIVIAFDWEYLRELRRLLPEQVLGALGPSAATRLRSQGRDRLTASLIDRVMRMGVDLVVWNNKVGRTAINAAHGRGMRVWVYTVNDPVEADTLAQAGVDGLISDNPAMIWRALALHG